MQRIQGLFTRMGCILRVIRMTGFRCWRRSHLVSPFTFVVRGKRFHLSAPNDEVARSVFCEVIVDDCYGLRSLDNLGSEPIIVDIGANIGAFSSYARVLYPHSTIHAYDPHPVILPSLKENGARFGFTVHPMGVSNRTYDAILDANAPVTCASLDAPTGFTVPVITPSVICPNLEIDLLKIDCEGAEHEIFEDEGFLKRIRRIRMEYHAECVEKNDALRATLTRSGFTITYDRPHAGCHGLIGLLFAVRK